MTVTIQTGVVTRHSAPSIVPADPVRDREWWAAEAERVGSDWKSVGDLALDIISTWLMESSFERACRIAEEKAHQEPPKPRAVPPTPQTTVDAVLYSLAKRGLGALLEPATKERLSRCDKAALAQIDACVRKLREGAYAGI